MVSQYETVFVLNPVMAEGDCKKTASEYVKFLKESGASIVEETNWGIRQLAYPIQKKNTGYYYIVEYKGNGDIVKKLETEFRRDENIMRFLTIALDKHSLEYNDKKRRGEVGANRVKKVKEEAQL